MAASRDREAVGTPGKISGVDLVTAEIFDVAKSAARQIAYERGGIEEQLKGFTGAGYSLGQRIERALLDGVEKRSLDGEVKHDAASRRHAGDESDGGVKGGPGKIGRDAQPGEKRSRRRAEADLLQPGIERLRLGL